MNIIFFRAFYSRIGCSWTRFNLERGVGFSWNSPLWSSAVSPVANGRAKTPVTRVTRPAKRQQETRVLFFSSSFTPPLLPAVSFSHPPPRLPPPPSSPFVLILATAHPSGFFTILQILTCGSFVTRLWGWKDEGRFIFLLPSLFS